MNKNTVEEKSRLISKALDKLNKVMDENASHALEIVIRPQVNYNKSGKYIHLDYKIYKCLVDRTPVQKPKQTSSSPPKMPDTRKKVKIVK